MEIKILIPKRTNRLVYIFKHIFRDRFGLKVSFTLDQEEFTNYEGVKIHYGNYPLANEFFIASDQLLFMRGIQDQEVSICDYNGLPALFQTYSRQSKYPFDLFAASFYLLSRYEEYLPFIKDKHGRYSPEESIAYNQGFLQKPIVDIWINDLAEKLKSHFPKIEIKEETFNFIPSIDIDAAFAHKHKGMLRILGGYAKNILDMDMKALIYKTKVLLGKEKDPFNTFEYLFDIHQKHNLKAIFFILFADYGTNDKNTPTYNRHFKELVAYIADHAHLGIHPSYTSNVVEGKLKKEIHNLSKTIHRDIEKSRQHFLILHLPGTYRKLIELGITDDYTMGYASQIGFRASTSRSFLFYDLETESTTSLKIHPFAAMEGTLKDYQNLDVAEAWESIKNIIDEIKAVNGTYISLWHNESVSDKGRWVGWRKIYEDMIEYAVR